MENNTIDSDWETTNNDSDWETVYDSGANQESLYTKLIKPTVESISKPNPYGGIRTSMGNEIKQTAKGIASIPYLLDEATKPSINSPLLQPENAVKGAYNFGKETVKGMIEPFKNPKESFEKAPIGTVTSWYGIGSLTKGLSKATLGALERKMYPVKTDVIKALNPNPTEFEHLERTLPVSVPEINRISIQNNIPLNNKANIEKAIEIGKQENINEWKKLTAEIGTENPKVIEGNNIAKAMEEVITDRFKNQNPELAKSIENKAKFYKGKTVTVEEADKWLKETNAELDNFYKKNDIKQKLNRRDPTAGYLVAEGEALRNEIYGALDHFDLGGKGKELMNKWGSLNEFESVLAKQGKKAFLEEPTGAPALLGKKLGGVAERAGKIDLSRPASILNVPFGKSEKVNDLLYSAFRKYNNALQPVVSKQGKKALSVNAILNATQTMKR